MKQIDQKASNVLISIFVSESWYMADWVEQVKTFDLSVSTFRALLEIIRRDIFGCQGLSADKTKFYSRFKPNVCIMCARAKSLFWKQIPAVVYR